MPSSSRRWRIAQNANENQELSDQDCRWIETTAREIADDLSAAQPPTDADEHHTGAERVRILGVAARAVGDLAALQFLADQLPATRWESSSSARAYSPRKRSRQCASINPPSS